MSKASSIPGNGWATPSAGMFQLGRSKTLAIPMDVHVQARKNLVTAFAASGNTDGVVLMQGGEEYTQYDTDTDVLFRQDSWFNHLFGVKESGFYGAIQLSDGWTVLFIPRLPDSYKIWCGEVYPPQYFKDLYKVDEVLYVEELIGWLQRTPTAIHVLNGVNSDSGLRAKGVTHPGLDAVASHIVKSGSTTADTSLLYDLLSNCRVTKSPEEIEVMRYCAYVATNAHVEVMRNIKDMEFEYEIEAKFLYEIYRNGGCRRSAYISICACGPNNSVLHYGHAGVPNDRALRPTDMALLDMGAEYHGYVSDITCTSPKSGKFSADQRAIYEGVLNAQRAVYAIIAPGVTWTQCHLAAEREVIKALASLGILHGGDINTYAENLLGAVFFPHGLGHLIGCDVHDVGGYLAGTPARSHRPGLSKLRTARVLEAGMVMTNEPGCYFIDALMDAALSNLEQVRYINQDVLQRFRGFGGVRLEDVFLVTSDGVECMSTCPRLVEEVEDVIAGGPWPPLEDKAPELKRRWTALAPSGLGMVDITLGNK